LANSTGYPKTKVDCTLKSTKHKTTYKTSTDFNLKYSKIVENKGKMPQNSQNKEKCPKIRKTKKKFPKILQKGEIPQNPQSKEKCSKLQKKEKCPKLQKIKQIAPKFTNIAKQENFPKMTYRINIQTPQTTQNGYQSRLNDPFPGNAVIWPGR
jgi:hypothetical protein